MKLFTLSKVKYLVALSFVGLSFIGLSQDDCASAVPVADLSGVVCATATPSATNALGAGGCEEGILDTWFSFVAQGTVADFTVTSTIAGWQPEITIAESDDGTCAGGFFEVACGDANGSYAALTLTGVTGLIPGNTYWVLISSDVDLTTGSLDLCVTNPLTAANDNCESAFNLPLDGTCVAGTTVLANDESTGVDGCQDGTVATHPDVFYSFVADSAAVEFALSAGTMTGTGQLVVYTGLDCSALSIHGSLCGTMPFTDSLPAFFVGATYWVAVSTNATEGTFSLCATSYTPVPTPGQDCPDAALVCDDAGFSVGSINSGGGLISGNTGNENISLNSCFGGDERQSQWYTFTCNETGDLEFQIAPNTWADDYDWAVYDITTSGCVITPETPIVCNWSGCNGMTGVTSDVTQYTGGETSASDYLFDNPPGPGDCLGAVGDGDGSSQWENEVTLIEGNTYAILIDNYSTTSNDGFSFNFEGTDAGIGVDASFAITSGSCNDFNVTISDTIGALNSAIYTWDWGDGSPVTTGTLSESHDYTAAGMGTYSVHLAVEDGVGCLVDYFITVSVGTDIAAEAGAPAAVCAGSPVTIGGAPSATGGNGVYTYLWTPNAGTLNDSTIANPDASPTVATTYTLTVTDGLGCSASDDVLVSIVLAPVITTPTNATVCDSYVLPAITGTDITAGAAYYDAIGGSGGAGTMYSVGSTINFADFGSYPVILYAYDEVGACFDEESFSLVIVESPIVDPIANVVECDSFQLVAITGTLTGNEGYYSATGGTGTTYAVGDWISANTTIFAYDSTTAAPFCSDEESFTITINTALISGNAPICSGTTLGLTGTGTGTPTSWSSATPAIATIDPVTGVVTGVAGGTSIIQYTDANGCVDTTLVTVHQTPLVNNPGPLVSCDSIQLPAITGTLSGSEGYYSLTGGAGTTFSVGDWVTGSTSIFIYDESGTTPNCVDEETLVITINSALISGNAPICVGETLTLTGSGTAAGWVSATPATATIDGSGVVTGVAGGTTIITYTDANGCIDTTLVTVNALPVVNIPAVAAVCAGADVVLTEDAGDATSWMWSSLNGTATITSSGIQTPTISDGVNNETFQVIGTDANGCVDSTTLTIAINDLPVIASDTTTPTACNALDGSIQVTLISGPTATGNLSWTGTATNNAAAVLPDDITGLGAGSYNVTFTDANGCVSNITSEVLNNPGAPIIDFILDTVSCGVDYQLVMSDITGTNLTSNLTYYAGTGGTGGVIADGTIYTAPTNINIFVRDSNGVCKTELQYNILINVVPTLTLQDTTVCSPGTVDLTDVTYWSTDIGTMSYFEADGTTPVANELLVGAGTYVLSANNLGCITTGNVIVSENTTPTLTLQDTTVCSPAMVDLTDVTYWSTDVGTISFFESDGTTPVSDETMVGAGTYVLSANNLGCISTGNVIVSENTTPTLTLQDTTVCSPATVNITDVTYWSTDIGSLSYFEVDGVTPLATPTTAGAGMYVLSADNLGCVTTGNVTVVVVSTPTLTLQDTTVCSPATVDLTDLIYWNNTESAPMNWFSDVGLTMPIADVTLSGAGTYYVQAGVSGCSVDGSVVITANTTPTLTLQDTTVCSPAVVDLTDVTYWSTDVGTLSYFEADGVTPMATPATAGAGMYVLSADNLGCVTTGNITVTVNTTPTLTVQDSTVCSPAVVDLTDVTYWSTDVGTLSYFEADGVTPMATPATAGAGMYVLSADNSGCVTPGNITVAVNTTPTLTLQDTTVCSPTVVDLTDVTYWSADIGTLSYFESDGTTPMTTQATAGAGMYVISANNAGCITTGNVTVTVNTTPTLTLQDTIVCSPATVNITDVTYWSADIGTLSYFESDGTTPMTTQATAGAGMYVISANNAGCITIGNVTVTVVTTPTVDALGPITACDTYALPVIAGTDLSGTQAYYDATGGPSAANVVTGPITSNATLFMYDGASGCSDEQSVVITINALPSVTNVSGEGTYCAGDAVNDIVVDVTGAANWSVDYTLDGAVQNATGATSPINLGNAAGVYVVTNVTDANCTNTAAGTQTIVVNAIPSAPTAGNDSEYCSTVPFADMTASGNGGVMTWYSDAGLTNIITTGGNLAPNNVVGTTTYYVTETMNGCEGPSSQVLTTVNFCSITIPTALTPDGDGVNDDWEILDIDQTYPENIVYVYNRWGALLFTSIQGDYDNSRWDGTYKGKELPVGSYYFIIEFNDEENEKANGVVSIILNK